MATIEKMTVHKALAELKLLDSRIANAIGDGIYCVANKHSNEKIDGISIEDYKKRIQGSYDKTTDLINRRNSIKRAVVLSNAVTKVQIAGKEYTVAEAIEMKNHGVEFDKKLLSAMQLHYQTAQMQIKKQNGIELEERADQYVTALYGSKDSKTNTADIEKVRADFISLNQYDLIDPLNIPEKIEELESKINNFMAEVDSTLSVSNALTEIDIEY